MLIVDSQVHLWVAGRIVTPGNAHHLHQAVFSKDDLLPRMDAAGVDRVVIVPPGWDSNDHAIEAARLHPDRFAVMGRIALDRPESRALLPGWKQQPGMLGLRLVFNPENSALLTEGKADWIWPEAERLGIPIMVLAPNLLQEIKDVAQRHPALRLTIDHLGVTRNAKGDAAFAHLPQILELAKYPNIAVKASGLALYSGAPYPFRNIDKYVRQVVDTFGPHRVFWGTDLSRMPCSYRQCVTHFTEELPWLSEADKELIMGRALCDWIGWKLPN
jgi:predicted TIM-barrel fold metal-dependent hydrolase